jgi:Asp-tRNA(Asn)/Glu-tRNA(Gln) amidotransferase A subunit family amidase
MKNVIARRDAPVIDALEEAGAVLLGKTNMWPFAYGIPYGPYSHTAWGETISPYTGVSDFDGSSTGSAAATAANLCAFAMSGDTGSSIRLPSARCALVGGRPSLYLLPGSGTIPANITLDVIGPMTRTVADYARVMDVVVFDDPNPLDIRFFPRSSNVRPRSYLDLLAPGYLRGKVVGLPKPYIGKDSTGNAKPLEPSVQANWDIAVQKLQQAGATVKEIDWPFYHRFSRDTPEGAALSYASVGLGDTQFSLMWQWCDAYYFDAHLRTYRDPKVRSVLDLPAPTAKQDPDYFDKIHGFQRFFRQGVAKSFTAYRMRDYFAAYRRWAKRDVENVMIAEGVDLLAFPTSGRENPDQEQYEYLNALSEGTFLGLPQISVPIGFSPAGRPQGMLIMGRTYYSEPQILAAAQAFERVYPARRPPASTPPLPGETITYRPRPVTGRAETVPPALAIQPRLRRTGAGPNARYRLDGSALDASGVASVEVWINGRRAGIKTAAQWSVRLSARKFERITRSHPRSSRPVAIVVAKDTLGNVAGAVTRLTVVPDA